MKSVFPEKLSLLFVFKTSFHRLLPRSDRSSLLSCTHSALSCSRMENNILRPSRHRARRPRKKQGQGTAPLPVVEAQTGRWPVPLLPAVIPAPRADHGSRGAAHPRRPHHQVQRGALLQALQQPKAAPASRRMDGLFRAAARRRLVIVHNVGYGRGYFLGHFRRHPWIERAALAAIHIAEPPQVHGLNHSRVVIHAAVAEANFL